MKRELGPRVLPRVLAELIVALYMLNAGNGDGGRVCDIAGPVSSELWHGRRLRHAKHRIAYLPFLQEHWPPATGRSPRRTRLPAELINPSNFVSSAAGPVPPAPSVPTSSTPRAKLRSRTSLEVRARPVRSRGPDSWLRPRDA